MNNTLTTDIIKVIERETGYRYGMCDLAFECIEDTLADLGTFDEELEEVVYTAQEEVITKQLEQQLKDNIDNVFLKITKMLKRKHGIEIVSPTHKDFGYLLETEMADFMDVILSSLEQNEIA